MCSSIFTRGMLPLPIALLAFGLSLRPCMGQGMSFSVYTDVTLHWDLGSFYVVSTAYDNSWGCTHSSYTSQIWVYSPSGRYVTSQTTGMVVTATMPILNEFGTYGIARNGSYFCSCIGSIGWYGSGSSTKVCPVPTNFHQETGIGRLGALYFIYKWDSSSGNKAHLSSCTIGERVDYGSIPRPPFPNEWNPANPSEESFSAEGGEASDVHPNPDRSGPFRKPYSNAVADAYQYYWYSCPCDGSIQRVLKPLTEIWRGVYLDPFGLWTYGIQKDNVYSSVLLPP